MGKLQLLKGQQKKSGAVPQLSIQGGKQENPFVNYSYCYSFEGLVFFHILILFTTQIYG